MSVLSCEPTVSVPQNECLSVPAPTLQRRYFGLDGVRATAMLLGVFYHLPIAFMAGGFGMGFGFGGSPKTPIDNWLHSFRMPLFFLISGFFANMMLSKYGLRRYLTRRWWRIGAPLLMAFLLLVGLRMATEYFRANPLPGFGRPTMGMPGFGPPGMGMPGFGAGPFGFPGAPGPGGPGADGPGTGGAPTPGTFGGGGGGRFGNFGPMPGGTVGGPGTGAAGGFGGPFGGPAPGGFGPPGGNPFGGGPFGGGPFGPPANGPAGPPAEGRGAGGPAPQLAPGAAPPAPMMEMPSRSWSDALFGNQSRHLNLEHLWFLWYLLIFVTVGPLAVKLISLPLSQKVLRVTDRTGYYLIRFNLLALIVGLVTLPALVHAHGFMGWSLANPIGFSAPFPDFLVQYYADEPYYFLYFLVGWWIFRQRDRLADLARHWLWNFVIGIAGFALSQHLADLYALRTDDPHYDWVRIAGFAFYGIGAAYTACGFIGFFQLYLDRPTRLSRYFADTALWIYLAHLPLIPYLMWWVQPANSAWWTATLGGMVIVTGVSLVMFETLIRPTPFVYIFGPPSPKRSSSQSGHTAAAGHP